MRFTRVLFVVSLLALVLVPAALAIRFTDDSYNPPLGETGKPYPNWSFTGAGGCGPALPYQFTLQNSSSPPGLTIDKSGLVHGIPTAEGEFSFWLELSDENPPSASWCRPATAQRMFTIKIVAGLNIQQQALAPKVASLNKPYSFQLTSTGGGSQVWSIQSGSLPGGLSLSNTGLLSGTPTTTGDYTFVVKVADGTRTDTETYTLSVAEELKISQATATASEVGLALQVAPQATGGKPGYTWSLTSGNLPAGVTLDTATGAISGRPTAAGSFPVTLAVTDSIGLQTTVNLNLVVAPKLAITKRPLKAAKVGKAYKARLLATGGVNPRQWNLLGGRPGLLPKGMKLNRRTGELSGTPTKSGIYRLRIQVVDKLGAKSATGYVLKVVA
jgi:large repetitive protein